MHRFIARLKVELIVLIGYAAGILLIAGFFMDPAIYTHDTLLGQLRMFIEITIPDLYIRTTIALILLLALFLLVKKALAIGGPGAIVASVMGFLAGLATPTDLLIGLIMLGIGVICAYISITGWKTLANLRLKRPKV